MNQDFRLSELRIVEVYFKDNHIPSHRYMHESQVKTFVEATVKLHYEVGNPHVKDRPSKPGDGVALLWRINVCRLSLETTSYWWCHPSLHANREGGAQLNIERGEAVWEHPDLIKANQEADASED